MEVNSYDKIEDSFTLISRLDKAQEVFDFYLADKPSENHVLAMQFIIDEDTCLGLSITFASDKVYFIKTDQDITVSYLLGSLNLLDNNYILSTINLKDQLII